MELADDALTGREFDPDRYEPLTLKRMMADRARMPAQECAVIGVELARALVELHRRRLVHRDVKPSNVIFVGGVPKLADIGLVAIASDSATFIGTEGFVPPEGPGSTSADVFALGKVLYEMSTGLDRKEFPRFPSDLRSFQDREQFLELNEILIKACHPAQDHRHADAEGILADLMLLLAGKSVRRLRNAERRLGRSLRLIAVFAVIAAVAGAGAIIERARLASETNRRLESEAKLETLARQTLYTASLNRAQRAIDIGDFGLARRALDQIKADPKEAALIGFEWKALSNRAMRESVRNSKVAGRAIRDLSVSSDGTLVAGALDDNTACIWTTDDLVLRARIPGVGMTGGISQDDRWLFGTDQGLSFSRWSVATGKGDVQESRKRQWEDPLEQTAPMSMASISTSMDSGKCAIRLWDFDRKAVTREVPIAIEDERDWGLSTRLSDQNPLISS